MKVAKMAAVDSHESHWLKKELRLLRSASDILFHRAPCMMHMLNAKGKIVKVNQQWLSVLGYKENEVVGRRSSDFLTKESRDRAVEETLPLFWRVGSARSVGYQFVTKGLRRLPVLLDAEALTDKAGNRFSAAVIYPNEDLSNWNEARHTLEAFSEISGVQNNLEILSSHEPHKYWGSGMQTERHPLGPLPTSPITSHVLGEFLERADDVSASLRGLVRTHEELLDIATNQLQELSLEVKSVGRTLKELVDVVATRLESEEPPEAP